MPGGLDFAIEMSVPPLFLTLNSASRLAPTAKGGNWSRYGVSANLPASAQRPDKGTLSTPALVLSAMPPR